MKKQKFRVKTLKDLLEKKNPVCNHYQRLCELLDSTPMDFLGKDTSEDEKALSEPICTVNINITME